MSVKFTLNCRSAQNPVIDFGNINWRPKLIAEFFVDICQYIFLQFFLNHILKICGPEGNRTPYSSMPWRRVTGILRAQIQCFIIDNFQLNFKLILNFIQFVMYSAPERNWTPIFALGMRSSIR